jgi:cysteine synthase
MLQKCVTPKTKTIIEYSSGSTVISMALIARAVHGIEDVHAYVSNKTTETKLRLLRFFGLNLWVQAFPNLKVMMESVLMGVQHALRRTVATRTQ